jgi:PKD repeat protein
MATPMTAATAALIWSQNPTWTAAQVTSQLYSSADNIDAYLSSQYLGKMGAGRINAYNAVNTGPPPAPVADFSGSPTSGTEPLTVNFTDLSTGSISTWDWTFGDGGTSTAQNPSYTYTSAGTYSVTLTVTGPGGTDALTRTNYITVDPCTNPTADFVGSPTSGDYPLTVNFTNQSSGATSYSWTFGDGGTSTAANPSYTYTAAGTYTVTLTATNACGSDQLVRTNYITVTTPPCDPPVADFSGSPTSGTYPLTVNFTDLSTNSPTSWSWAFGDGGTSTAQNPSYTYTAAGTYTVEMTATNACGFDNVVKTGYITVTAPSVETAMAEQDISILGTFTNTFSETHASDDVYETISEALSTSHPRKTTSEAEHKWTFTVNATGAATFYLEAYRSDNADGDDFTFAYSTDDVTYVNLVTVASATEQVYTASMPSGLTGTVYIRVVDTDRAWGNSSLDDCYIDNMYIEYSSTPGPPVANFAGDPTSGVVPLAVNFTDLSTGNPTSWSWDFGDGGTSTAQNPSHTYTLAGSYTVSLTATNGYGSGTETKVDYITVIPAGQILRVSSIDVVRQTAGGPNRQAVATVTVVDGNGTAVSGASVSGYFNAPNGNIKSGTTDGSGVATMSSDKTKTPPVDWCFTVTDVSLAGYTWNQGDTTGCESTTTLGIGGPAAAKLLPSDYALSQNYPNPFNPTTEIEFALPQASNVSLSIYNVVGQRVDVLVDGYMEAGVHHVTWEADGFATGMYFYRLTTNTFTQTKKMLLVK